MEKSDSSKQSVTVPMVLLTNKSSKGSSNHLYPSFTYYWENSCSVRVRKCQGLTECVGSQMT